jgi:hypothetical protein
MQATARLSGFHPGLLTRGVLVDLDSQHFFLPLVLQHFTSTRKLGWVFLNRRDLVPLAETTSLSFSSIISPALGLQLSGKKDRFLKCRQGIHSGLWGLFSITPHCHYVT